jgi:hypothetical protein
MNEPDYIYTTAEQVLVPYGKGTLLHQLARMYFPWQSVDPSILTEQMLLSEDADGLTVAHWLAHRSGIKDLPPALITPRLLMARNRSGITVLHALAQYASLEHMVPLLTRDMLMATEDENHRTVIEWAADREEDCEGIAAVAHLLDSEMLMMKSNVGRTVLHYAMRNRFLDRIQPSAFRPGWMSRKFRGRTLAQILTEDHVDYVGSHLGEFHEKVRAAILARLLAK